MPALVLSLTDDQIARAAAALGRHLRLTNGQGAPRAATQEEMQSFLRSQIAGIVLQQERRVAESAVPDPEPFE